MILQTYIPSTIDTIRNTVVLLNVTQLGILSTNM